MPIRWKKDKLKVPVFRHFKGAVLSEDEAMLYTKLLDDMRRQSLESGQEKTWTPKFSRTPQMVMQQIRSTRDPRNVRDMVPEEVWAKQPPDPEIVNWEAERATLEQGRYRIAGSEDEDKIRVLTEDIRKKKTQSEKRIVKEYSEYYFCNRPTWDIEAQARGEVEEEYEVPTMDLVIPERARLAEVL
ncbi:FluG domain-containing protein [Moelleriella libera RCEF 2490]|uniref:FluG domain-containing protein n=1 Tax=Moelleriella libera RCEF 2490 TaxID=1081109 RepID=A0A168DGD7_9HYPO|nr:FluG domain-containing protein [Moelleriella libera RCEF 2490]